MSGQYSDSSYFLLHLLIKATSVLYHMNEEMIEESEGKYTYNKLNHQQKSWL